MKEFTCPPRPRRSKGPCHFCFCRGLLPQQCVHDRPVLMYETQTDVNSGDVDEDGRMEKLRFMGKFGRAPLGEPKRKCLTQDSNRFVPTAKPPFDLSNLHSADWLAFDLLGRQI